MSSAVAPGPFADALPAPAEASAPERVRAAYDLIDAVDRPEIWITLVDRAVALRRAEGIEDRRRREGPAAMPLAGWLIAVKDNIDVAGLPTTAGCPSFAYTPAESSPAVRRLVDAGAIVLGKTNLDQFATGLVGTRSPYGAVRHATRPDRISGGSSSGSAVAVAMGIVDVALGTDTAGSGRVPAALHGLIGLKPTLGLVSMTGVVPACRSYDTVSVFGRTVADAQRALAVISEGTDSAGMRRGATRLSSRDAIRVGVPDVAALTPLSPDARAAFAAAVERLGARGVETVPFDVEPFLRAARLLYDGALVAERCEAAGSLVEEGAAGLDPTVAEIIRRASGIPASRLVADRALLARMRDEACEIFADSPDRAGLDALLLPTTTEHPTLAAVAADPVRINSRMGTYTNFVNLFDLCAAAVPAGTADGSPFGVSLIGPPLADQALIDLAALFLDAPRPELLPGDGIDLVVFGAHLDGMPLNHQLRDLRARYRGEVLTAPSYRMHLLPGEPAKPGVVPVAHGGAALLGECWTLTPAAFARFVSALPAPMSIGDVQLSDGSRVLGFQCAASAVQGTEDISEHGGWAQYLRAVGA